MLMSCCAPARSQRPMTTFTTIAAPATPIISAPLATAGIADPLDRFPSNQQRDDHQRHGVGERRQHADAVVAEGHPVVRPLVAMDSAYQLKPSDAASGQVVAGIGQQRETRPEPAAQRLDGHEREREDERGAQRPLGHPRGDVRVAVDAVVRVIVWH